MFSSLHAHGPTRGEKSKYSRYSFIRFCKTAYETHRIRHSDSKSILHGRVLSVSASYHE